MYAVSNEYINKLKSVSVKRGRIRGYLDSIAFTENDILMQSFKYSDIAVSSADIKLGGVFISTLNLTFLRSFIEDNNIARGSWRGRKITASIGLLIGYDEYDEEIWEDVPLKPYFVDEANHNSLGVNIVSYDDMSKFDKPIQFETTTGNPYGLASLCCASCGVTLGMTQVEMEALPNGNKPLVLGTNNDIETYRDLISHLAVVLGGFATINREGKLEFRTWNIDPVLTLTKYDRFEGGTFSDFTTNYTGLMVTNDDSTISYYSMPVDDGLTLNIGKNPLANTDDIRNNILYAVNVMKYVPFKSQSLFGAFLDLGDVIKYTGGLADDQSLCCVMRIDYQYSKGTTLQGFGKNPAMMDAKSKTDKAVSAASKNQKNNEIIFHSVVNASDITITTAETVLYRIEFITTDVTTLALWHEFKEMNEFTEDCQNVELFYYYDGVIETYEPVDTFTETDEYHTQVGNYWLQNVPAGMHRWEVRARTSEGTAKIKLNDLHALLWGQKVAVVEGGIIPPLEDTYTLTKLGTPKPVELEDELVYIGEPTPSGNYLDLHDGTYLELHDGTGLELHDGGNE